METLIEYMALNYQEMPKQCLKKVFSTSKDFLPNGSVTNQSVCVPGYIHKHSTTYPTYI